MKKGKVLGLALFAAILMFIGNFFGGLFCAPTWISTWVRAGGYFIYGYGTGGPLVEGVWGLAVLLSIVLIITTLVQIGIARDKKRKGLGL